MKIHLLYWLPALLTAHSSAQVSVFENPGGRPGGVVIFAGTELRPPELQQIQLILLDCVGRTRLSELLETQSRLRTDIPGASRLLLPGEEGSLYKYRRDDRQGPGASFGFFLVGADGIARRVFEVPGSGVLGKDDPMPGKISVARSGDAILLATTPAAGGDLWEIDLATGNAANLTLDFGPQTFLRNGLALLTDWGIGVSDSGVFRFARPPVSQAELVRMPVSYAWLGGEVVSSADESTVAFLAGDDASRAFVVSCERAGDARQASETAMRISGAGFLPEAKNGPTLALSTDGSRVVWRAEGVTRENWMSETRSGGPDEHLTGDANFSYTLNDTGVISFFDPETVVFVAGRRQGDDISRADVFRLKDNSVGRLDAVNLSGTSGITVPPFDYGALDTADGIHRVPWQDPAFLVHRAGSSGQGELLWVDARNGTTSLLRQVESLDFVEIAGSHLVAGIHRPPGVDRPGSSLNLVYIPQGGLDSTAVLLPAGCRVSRTAGSRTRNQFAAVLEIGGSERLGMTFVPTPTSLALSSPSGFGPTVGTAADGTILSSALLSGESWTFAWSGSSFRLVSMSAPGSFLLPGL